MARWFESRRLWGILLILAGLAFLLQNLGLFPMGDLFWALLFGFGGVAFLSIFVANRENWWGLIPGFALLGIGLLIALGTLAPGFADRWGGSIVLGAIGLSFMIIYLIRRDFWWAIIPAGILLTLAILTGLEAVVGGFNMGGLLLLGIGLTFAMVAVTPTPEGRNVWAWIPAGILSLIGLLILAETELLIGYIWPVVLILLGLVLVYRAFIHRG